MTTGAECGRERERGGGGAGISVLSEVVLSPLNTVGDCPATQTPTHGREKAVALCCGGKQMVLMVARCLGPISMTMLGQAASSGRGLRAEGKREGGREEGGGKIDLGSAAGCGGRGHIL